MILWLALLLVLPLQEGSATPAGLLTAHLLLLAAVAATASRLGRLRTGLLVPALAALCATALAGALGSYRFASLLALADLAAMLTMLVLGETLARSRPRFAELARPTIVLAGTCQAALVLGTWIGSGFRDRSPGTLLNTDHAAAYMLLAFWALIAGPGFSQAAAASEEGPKTVRARVAAAATHRSVMFAAAATIIAAALLQASRGAIVAILAGGGVYLAVRLRAMTRRARVGVACASLAIALAAAALLAHRFTVQDDPYRWDRLRLWGVALDVAAQHPLVGAGPGLFGYVTAPLDLPREGWPVRYAKHVEATHSDYLRVASETGIAGTLAFAALLLAVVALGARAVRLGGSREAALGAAVAGLLVQCLFENLSTRPAVACTGALLAALLIARVPLRSRAAAEKVGGAVFRPADTGPAGSGISFSPDFASSAVPSPDSPSAGGGSLFPPDIATPAAPLSDAGPAGGGVGFPPDAAPPPVSPAASLSVEGRAGLLQGAGSPASGRTSEPSSRGLRFARAVLLYGGLLWAGLVLVVAPYLAYRSFALFERGGPLVGKHYASAIFWNPIQPDYRSALAEAVLAGKAAGPADLRSGFLAIGEAIALKPVDPRYFILRARLARQAFLAGGGESDWIRMANEDYSAAIRLDPHRPQGRLERGWMLLDLGRSPGALADAEAALESEPNSFEARRLRASALLDLHREAESRIETVEARRRHELLARVSPSNPYEEQVLMWDADGWAKIEKRLGMQ